MKEKTKKYLNILRKVVGYKSYSCQIEVEEIDKQLWKDKDFVRLILIKDIAYLKFASDELKADRELILFAISYSLRESSFLEFCSEDLRSDKEFVIKSVDLYANNLEFASDELKKDKEVVTKAYIKNDYASEYMHNDLLSNKDFILELMSISPSERLYSAISKELQNDIDIINKAIKSNNVYKLLNIELRNDKDIILKSDLFGCFGSDYSDEEPPIPEALRGDKDIAIIGSINGDYKYLNKKLKEDRDVLLCALAKMSDYDKEQNDFQKIIKSRLTDPGINTLYMAKTWGNDWKVVKNKALWKDFYFAFAACVKDMDAYQYVDDTLKENETFINLLCRTVSDSLSIPEKFRDNIYLAKKAVFANRGYSTRPQNLTAFSEKVKGNKQLALELLNAQHDVLEYLSDDLKDDIEIVRIAVRNDIDQLQYASDNIKSDKSFVLNTLKSYNRSKRGIFYLKYLPDLLKDDDEIVFEAVRINGSNIYDVSNKLKENRELAVLAAQSEAHLLQNDYKIKTPKLNPDFRKDEEIVLTILAYEGIYGIEYADEKFRGDEDIMMDCVAYSYSTFEYATQKLKNNIEYLKKLKEISLDIFEWVSEEVKSQILSIKYQTKTYRSRKIECLVVPEDRVSNNSSNFQQVYIKKARKKIICINNFTVVEWEDHGPVGSYISESANNTISLVGDFVFYRSFRGLDSVRNYESGSSYYGKGSGPDIEDRANELWIIDFPKKGIKLDLSRERKDNKKEFKPGKDIHLLTKGDYKLNGVELFKNKGDGRSCYDALSEVAKGADAETYKKFFVKSNDSYECYLPNEISACGGAASIHVDGLGYRWIFPTEDGYYTWNSLKKELESTTSKDDWNRLKTGFLKNYNDCEKTAVVNHFNLIDDKELLEKVNNYFDKQ